MHRISELGKLGHLAWVIEELLLLAALVRREGRCLGELRPHHVIIQEEGMTRAPSSWPRARLDRVRMRLHERHGHDDACHLLGVSAHVLHQFIEASRGIRGRALLHEAVLGGIDDCKMLRKEQQAALRAWERVHGRIPNRMLVTTRIERIITPIDPRKHDVALPEMSGEGNMMMERRGSRSRGSRRSFLLRDGSSSE